ncbi:hypothetical protein E2C01_009004 [Portunus trituberculatus]|uniref:Uncharacterized protein n=1 Tax=Portunus trituberculatus TaxID=210409 RepID=A0A5B7D539_PORTR|nr:hypothetical protein [Portunus trituberculatus]
MNGNLLLDHRPQAASARQGGGQHPSRTSGSKHYISNETLLNSGNGFQAPLRIPHKAVMYPCSSSPAGDYQSVWADAGRESVSEGK